MKTILYKDRSAIKTTDKCQFQIYLGLTIKSGLL